MMTLMVHFATQTLNVGCAAQRARGRFCSLQQSGVAAEGGFDRDRVEPLKDVADRGVSCMTACPC